MDYANDGIHVEEFCKIHTDRKQIEEICFSIDYYEDFSGSALVEEARQQCIDRVRNTCTAQHGNDSKGFNAAYYDCLEENMKLCPGFGE